MFVFLCNYFCIICCNLGIQKLIISGRISEATETIKNFFPNLLERNPRLAFQLKCRQFIEMVSGCDGEVKSYMHSPNRSARNTPSSSPSHTLLNTTNSKNCETNGISCLENGDKVLHENGSMQNDIDVAIHNGDNDADMVVDDYISNGIDHFKESPMDLTEDNRSHSISVITSVSKGIIN